MMHPLVFLISHFSFLISHFSLHYPFLLFYLFTFKKAFLLFYLFTFLPLKKPLPKNREK